MIASLHKPHGLTQSNVRKSTVNSESTEVCCLDDYLKLVLLPLKIFKRSLESFFFPNFSHLFIRIIIGLANFDLHL